LTSCNMSTARLREFISKEWSISEQERYKGPTYRLSVASSVYAVNTAVFSPNNTYGSTTSNQKYVLYHTAVQ